VSESLAIAIAIGVLIGIAIVVVPSRLAHLRTPYPRGQRGPDVSPPEGVPTTSEPRSALPPLPPTPQSVIVVLHEGTPPPKPPREHYGRGHDNP
jgi:hypothetical protein